MSAYDGVLMRTKYQIYFTQSWKKWDFTTTDIK